MSNTDALEAIEDIEEAYEEYGSSIILRKTGDDLQPSDPSFSYEDPSLNKGAPVDENLKGIVKSFASSKSSATYLKLLPQTVINKNPLEVSFYTSQILNKVEFKIIFETNTYEINHIFFKEIQNTKLLYTVVMSN